MSNAVELANKLLRRAAPKSGSSESERITAALEAVKIISENDLVVAEPPPKPLRKRKRNSSTNPSHPVAPTDESWINESKSNWTEIVVSMNHRCIGCGDMIYPGETAWVDIFNGYRHYDITCG